MATQICEPKVEKIDGFDKWEVEDAARTLTRAFEIKKKPKLLRAALKVVGQQKKAAEAVQGWASNIGG
jgi:hypothetical protein